MVRFQRTGWKKLHICDLMGSRSKVDTDMLLSVIEPLTGINNVGCPLIR